PVRQGGRAHARRHLQGRARLGRRGGAGARDRLQPEGEEGRELLRHRRRRADAARGRGGHAGRGHDAQGPGHRQGVRAAARRAEAGALRPAHRRRLGIQPQGAAGRVREVHRGARPGEPVRDAHRQGEGRRAGRGRPAHRPARHRRGGAPLVPAAQPAARRPGSLAGGGARARRRRDRQDHAQRLPDGARAGQARAGQDPDAARRAAALAQRPGPRRHR
ncbi:hypothetical protein EG878_17180, partial [Enterococcus faecalis]